MRPSILKITLLFILMASLAACGATAAPPATEAPVGEQATAAPTRAATGGGEAKVTMINTSFQPREITIQAGTRVTWTNEDPVPHTVTAGTRDNPSGLFDSGNIAQGQTFSFTFEEPGTYEYFCRIHPGMDGTIIVE